MNHRNVLSNLHYCGLVRGSRRNYHVFEGPQVFIVLSPRPGGHGGNYHVIERQALNYVLSRVGGNRSITTKEVRDACRRSKFLQDRFAVLNALCPRWDQESTHHQHEGAVTCFLCVEGCCLTTRRSRGAVRSYVTAARGSPRIVIPKPFPRRHSVRRFFRRRRSRDAGSVFRQVENALINVSTTNWSSFNSSIFF